jgi:hypothetical protein
VDQPKLKVVIGEAGRAKEGADVLSSLLATIAVSTNLEAPVRTSLFSSKPRPIELGVNFVLAMGAGYKPCFVSRLKAHKWLLGTKAGRAKEGADVLSSLLAMVAAPTNFTALILTSLFSSKLKTAEIGLNFVIAAAAG